MPENRVFQFEELNEDTPLIIDAIYGSGSNKNSGDDPLAKMLKVGNQGGFRKRKMESGDDFAYILLVTTGMELEWPDFLDRQTGIFRYYGDNRKYGRELLDTKAGGNKTLQTVFEQLKTEDGRSHIPPFLLFESTGKGRDMKFLGLAVPGTKVMSEEKELVAFWKTINGNRFQNYEAHFTVIDTDVPRDWLKARRLGSPDHRTKEPPVWSKFIEKGRNGIVPMVTEVPDEIPNKNSQLPQDEEGRKLVQVIRDYYRENPTDFERCAVEIVKLMDNHFTGFKLTRPRRDGGRDAVCIYRIGPEGGSCKLELHCAIEAKLYDENNGVGVRWTSRLISRIKNREFGILVTTSYVADQAFKEIKEDGHNILILNARDIAEILMRLGYDSSNIRKGLESVDYEEGVEYFDCYSERHYH